MFGRHGIDVPDEVFVRNGCSKCSGRGIKGRQPVHEMMTLDNSIMKHITHDPDRGAIEKAWVESGGKTLLHKALFLVADGLVEFDEAVEKT
jgi:type II secretory ATPase GspE/PulE/Tfp pilus assembly ATPase PilB-like protein